jgi:hypothetical protein
VLNRERSVLNALPSLRLGTIRITSGKWLMMVLIAAVISSNVFVRITNTIHSSEAKMVLVHQDAKV